MQISSALYSTSYVKSADSSASSDGKQAQKSNQEGGAVEEEFMNYMKKTPAERMFDSWLERHKISRGQFNALSPEEKKKLVDEFKQEMQEELRRKYGTSSFSGSAVNLTA